MKLRAENLMKSYSGRKVVKDVSLEVNQGEIVGLLGPNGAGKTTSFYMIVGIIKPNGGNIYLDDTNITKYPMFKRAQNGIGYLAQEASVFRKLSIEDNILSVLQLTKLSKKEQHEKVVLLFSLSKFGGPTFFDFHDTLHTPSPITPPRPPPLIGSHQNSIRRIHQQNNYGY